MSTLNIDVLWLYCVLVYLLLYMYWMSVVDCELWLCLFLASLQNLYSSLQLVLNAVWIPKTVSPNFIIVQIMFSGLMGSRSLFLVFPNMSHDMTKPTKWVCAQQGLRSAWASAQSDQVFACAQWVAKDPSFLHADSEDSDQTGRMPRLIWVFAGRTAILLVLSCRGSIIQCCYWAAVLLKDLLWSLRTYLSNIKACSGLYYSYFVFVCFFVFIFFFFLLPGCFSSQCGSFAEGNEMNIIGISDSDSATCWGVINMNFL